MIYKQKGFSQVILILMVFHIFFCIRQVYYKLIVMINEYYSFFFKILIILFCNVLFSQEKHHEIKLGNYYQANDSVNSTFSVLFNKPIHELVSQKASNAKNKGSYKQIINASQTSLIPGDSLKINYYISGYGFIDFTSAKLYYSSSANIIDTNKSYLKVDFRVVDDKIIYGGVDMPIHNSGLIPLSGVLFTPQNGITATYFDDFISAENPYYYAKKDNRPNHNNYVLESSLIYSEATLGIKGQEEYNAPLSFSVKLKENVPPGDYYLSFILTYFNGESWQNERLETKLKVMSWYEEYDSIIQWLALLIAIMTIITLILPTYKTIIGVVKKIKSIESIKKVLNLSKNLETQANSDIK